MEEKQCQDLDEEQKESKHGAREYGECRAGERERERERGEWNVVCATTRIKETIEQWLSGERRQNT